ncbi:MAG: hypothetical protein ACOCVF_01775 [bacterium]
MIVDNKIKGKIHGYYLIDSDEQGVKIATTSKPNWFRRICTWLFLGWTWIEIE